MFGLAHERPVNDGQQDDDISVLVTIALFCIIEERCSVYFFILLSFPQLHL
jgi:hypothetical protein